MIDLTHECIFTNLPISNSFEALLNCESSDGESLINSTAMEDQLNGMFNEQYNNFNNESYVETVRTDFKDVLAIFKEVFREALIEDLQGLDMNKYFDSYVDKSPADNISDASVSVVDISFDVGTIFESVSITKRAYDTDYVNLTFAMAYDTCVCCSTLLKDMLDLLIMF